MNSDDPIARFLEWLEHAKQCVAIPEPTAMTLATVDGEGNPSARVGLLKEAGARGFVFYTNLESAKARDIQDSPKVALNFYWMPLNRQVRVQGIADPVSDTEADVYFASRARESQIGAWASAQSRPLASREKMMERVEEYTRRFAGQPVPRPPFWSGWRVVPRRIEFWQQGDHRLHDRDLYTRQPDGWNVQKLYP